MSCGLEDTITVEPPTKRINDPLYSDTDYLNRYCGFKTEEDGNKDISFTGTEVYYKIYNNYSDLTSQRSAITSVNTTSNGTAAATKLIDTYTFQPLGIYPAVDGRSVFIDDETYDRTIIFRPKSYKNNPDYIGDDFETFRACVKFEGCLRAFVTVADPDTGGTKRLFKNVYYNSETSKWTYGDSNKYSGFTDEIDYSAIELCIPYRVGGKKSFDFFDDLNTSEDANTEPSQNDSDFYYNSSASAENTYYVQFFAVGVAFDSTSLITTYSLVLDLGSIAIIKDE